MARVNISARWRHLAEVREALDRLGPNADLEIQSAKNDLSGRLARIVKAAGRASDKQSARAAATVRQGRGDTMVTAGPHPLLFGSEFGALGRFGWYSKHRYINSRARQFRPHVGSGSYWFFRTIEENQPEIEQAWAQALQRITESWGA